MAKIEILHIFAKIRKFKSTVKYTGDQKEDDAKKFGSKKWWKYCSRQEFLPLLIPLAIFFSFFSFFLFPFACLACAAQVYIFVWVYGWALGVEGFGGQEQQEGAEKGKKIGIGTTLSTPINWRVCVRYNHSKCYHTY